jgi:CoA-dependent NAD(P)H sulfur oxidoreductase
MTNFYMKDLYKNYVVIGGNTAGLAAANQVRRLNQGATITVLEAGNFISYGSCSLPYFISGAVGKIDELISYPPGYFKKEKNIRILLNHRVTAIDTFKKEVTASVKTSNSGESASITFDYDRLIICSGASPVKLDDIPGAESKNVFYFRTVDDALGLKSYIDSASPKNAVIVGAGYIGLLLADALCKIGIKISLIESGSVIYSDYENEITDIIVSEIARRQIKIYTGSKLKEIKKNTGTHTAFSAIIENSKNPEDIGEIYADMFIISTGIRANTGFIKNTSIDTGRHGAIKVSAGFQTSQPGVYAAGDCCLIKNLITKVYDYIPNAQNALKAGRIAGANATGENEQFPGSIGTKVDKIFGLEVAKTGLGLQTATDFKFDILKVTDKGYSRVRAIPGAEPIEALIIVDRKTSRILGAQLAGKEGVAKRIDVFAAAIFTDMTVNDLYQLDTSYSPYTSTMPELVNKICGKAIMMLKKPYYGTLR